jgi:16S rRNA (uracil1498-N3)-methyltransferase
MRIHRVFIPDLQGGNITLTGQEAHHLSKVLRVSVGQNVKVFNGQGLEAIGIIQNVGEFQVILNLQSPQPSQTEAGIKITLASALLKGDKLSDVVRQATELGVVEIQPFMSQHCDIRELSANKLERLRRIAQEASKQSGRSVVPVIHEAIKLEALPLSPQTLVAHPYTSATLKDIATPTSNLMLITGPEGGLSNHEIETLVHKGAIALRLGPRILRAETAPIALIASILLPEAL